jgi:hypothetical protein
MSVNTTDLDQGIARMLPPAQEAMTRLSSALNGVGPEAAQHMKELSSFARAMVSEGEKGAADILAARADETIPRDERQLLRRRVDATRDTAKALMSSYSDRANKKAADLENAIVNTLLPAPSKDPATRLLIQNSLTTRYRHITAPDLLLQRITQRLGADQGHDAELMSTYGSDFLEGAGLNPDQVHGLRVQATDAYLKRTDGTRQQQAARNALAVYRAANIPGAIAAHREAGRLHLNKAD